MMNITKRINVILCPIHLNIFPILIIKALFRWNRRKRRRINRRKRLVVFFVCKSLNVSPRPSIKLIYEQNKLFYKINSLQGNAVLDLDRVQPVHLRVNMRRRPIRLWRCIFFYFIQFFYELFTARARCCCCWIVSSCLGAAAAAAIFIFASLFIA